MAEQKYECSKCRQMFTFTFPPAGMKCPSCGGPLYRRG